MLKLLSLSSKSLFALFSIITALSVASCGGSDSGDSTLVAVVVSGQAILGPLSGAEVNIENLDGVLIGTGTATTSSDMATAGSFTLTVNDSDIPEIALVSVYGGTDIDPDDDGVVDAGTVSKGVVHAYITKQQILDGSFTVNPLTEIIYQDISLQYPDGVESMPTIDLITLLNNESVKYLTTGTSYQDIISFIPHLDKADSIIPWSIVLTGMVKGVHEGESTKSIQKRVELINKSFESVGISTSADGKSIDRLDIVGSELVKTSFAGAVDASVSVLEQEYIDDDGVLVSARFEQLSMDSALVNVTITKAGHVLNINGATTLLQGLNFNETNIADVVDKIITVDVIDDAELSITIDKTIANRISDNEITFTIDGRQPTASELLVILDDPKISWNWMETQLIGGTSVEKQYVLQNYPDVTLYTMSDGTSVFEMSLSRYYEISGILDDGLNMIQDGLQSLAIDDASGILTVASKTALSTLVSYFSIASDAIFLVNTALPQISEEMLPSTRVKLLGATTTEGNVIPGVKYFPSIFIHNKNSTEPKWDITLNGTYLTEPSCILLPPCNLQIPHSLSMPLGEYELVNDKGYMIIPAKTVEFNINYSDFDLTIFPDNTPRISIEASVNNRWAVERNLDIELSTATISALAEFNYTISGSDVLLDASSSVSPDDAITSYIWTHDGVQIASGLAVSVPVSDIDSGNNVGEVTLEVSSSGGYTGTKQKYIDLSSASWDTNPNITSSLVAHYSFDGDVIDSSGNANHGSDFGGLDYVAGASGLAASFDGIDDYISLGDVESENMSACMWVSVDQLSDSQRLLSKRGVDSGIAMSVGTNNDFQSTTNVGSLQSITSNTILSDSEWNYVCMTVSDTVMNLFVNGQLESSMNVSGPVIFNDSVLAVGRESANYSGDLYHFKGSIDELSIYNRALTQAEIEYLLNSSRSLIAYYDFEGNANDLSGNGNDGVVYGAMNYAAGTHGQAASFDGIDDFVKVNDSPSLSSSSKTISFWFNATSDVNQSVTELIYRRFISKWSKDENGDSSSIYNEFNIWLDQGKISSTINTGENMDGNFSFDNAWHHLAVIYGDGYRQMYLDGSKITDEVSPTAIMDKTSPIIIGGGGSDFPIPIYMFHGLIDELRIHNRALTTAEVEFIYNN